MPCHGFPGREEREKEKKMDVKLPEFVWRAYGPNYSDDSRCPDPDFGIYQGSKQNVIDWIDLNNPGFRDHLEGRKFPKARLTIVSVKIVTQEMVEKLRLVLKQKAEADKALQEAKTLS